MSSNQVESPAMLESKEKPTDTEASSASSSLRHSQALEDPIPKSLGKVDAFATTFKPDWRFYVALASLCVLTLMAALDASSISVAIPTITSKLHGTAIDGFWSGTSFLLTCTVFQPVFGSFSDIFGRKPMIYVALVFFGVGAIMAAVAQGSMTLLLAGRALQGFGGGGILCLCEVIVTDLVPLRFRGNYFSLFGAMWALGSVSGPVIGGAFAEKASWRWIFWINLPFIGIGFPMVFFFLKLNFRATSLVAQLRRIDWVGIVLFVGSTTGFLIPITWGGVIYPWSSWRTLVPLLVSLAGLVAFVVWEVYFTTDPLIRTSVLGTRSAAATYASDFIHGVVLWSCLYYAPLYFQAVKAQAPIMSGVDMFPATFTVAPMAMLIGPLITKFGTYRWAVWAGWAMTTLGLGLQIMLDVHTTTAAWIFITLMTGIGTGMLFPSLTFAMQAAVPNKDQAYAVSLFTFFRAAGQSVGVAVGGTIFQNNIKEQIMKYPTIAAHAAEWSAESTALVKIIKVMPEGLAKSDLIQSYADALKVVWMVMCGLSGLALLISFLIQHFDLDRALETEQGFKYQEKNETTDV